ncbi:MULTISPECIES: hypothetical protein [unclassified Streptomyces]|uniref:hypothetical protein n=1 Tax=unclassified Streptomyces TaxID=2593676 RepID=UPI0004CBE9B0|nr:MULTISPECIES: hypothetical protein [unclassified Streptomyces]KOV93257.1 hypothetical protein ADL02_11115 [Streptomyces sp. NRRL WC-3723]
MRKLAIGTALSGALALVGLAAPAASAAGTPDLTFAGVTVNKGKPIVVGTTKVVNVPVSYTLTRPKDLVIDQKKTVQGVLLYRGTLKALDNELGPQKAPVCTTTATTDTTVTESCTETIVAAPDEALYEAADAGTWKAAGVYAHSDGSVSDDYLHSENDVTMWGNLASTQVKRAAQLTANAAPEPVVKGRTLTVKGKLTRANWATGTYTGYKDQKVVLQFKADGGVYANVRTITSGTGGALSTTVKAGKSGTYRFVFAGTATTGAKTSAGDHVTVK